MAITPPPGAAQVAGYCDPGFEPIRDEFERNFSDRGELGASVCLIHKGRTVLDMWGGSRDANGEAPWGEDTVVVVFSCTKGATALCAHVLASHGQLDLDATVAHYWPEFAREGKNEITVRMLLTHQAGLPGTTCPAGDPADFDAMVKVMESERPLWRPGSRHGYHALTFGWLVGQVVRRVAGETVGTFFRRNIAEPLALDFWIGLPASEEHRVASTVMGLEGNGLSARFDEALARGEPLQVTAMNSAGELLSPGGCDAPGAHAVEIPAANGVANARALAGMYAPLSLGGRLGEVELVSHQQLVEMGATETAGEDAVLLEPVRYSAGFEKATPGRAALLGSPGLIISERAFGHSGLGGSIGFADTDALFSFGYTPNRHPSGKESRTERCQVLIDAAYRAVGYHDCLAGKWA